MAFADSYIRQQCASARCRRWFYREVDDPRRFHSPACQERNALVWDSALDRPHIVLTRTCPWCQEDFTYWNKQGGGQIYCKDICRRRASKDRERTRKQESKEGGRQ